MKNFFKTIVYNIKELYYEFKFGRRYTEEAYREFCYNVYYSNEEIRKKAQDIEEYLFNLYFGFKRNSYNLNKVESFFKRNKISKVTLHNLLEYIKSDPYL